MALSAEHFEDVKRNRLFGTGGWCVMFPDTVTCDSETKSRGLKMCKECDGRCYRHEGAALPKVLPEELFNFNVWITFQKIEYDRLIGRYSDGQAKELRELYTKDLLEGLEKVKERQAEAKKHQDAIKNLFG